MPEVPTVEIQSPHDPGVKWIINESDFDPKTHVLWGESGAKVEAVPQDIPIPVDAPDVPQGASHGGMRPSVPDYIYGESGDIVAVNIINPQQRTSRLEIAYGDYDPDCHQLWSQHPRFN